MKSNSVNGSGNHRRYSISVSSCDCRDRSRLMSRLVMDTGRYHALTNALSRSEHKMPPATIADNNNWPALASAESSRDWMTEVSSNFLNFRYCFSSSTLFGVTSPGSRFAFTGTAGNGSDQTFASFPQSMSLRSKGIQVSIRVGLSLQSAIKSRTYFCIFG